VKAPAPGASPYGWVIEYPVGSRERHVVLIVNGPDGDRAAAERRAAELHGEIVTIVAERRGSSVAPEPDFDRSASPV
jgi:hypothetical protein